MRSEGFAVLMDLNQRSLRAQMKYANKLGARYTVVLGDNEVDTDRVQLKAMDTGGGNGSSAFYLCQRILQRQYAGAAGGSGDQRRSL